MEIEERCGSSFGKRDNPLLLSVRSGAAISMPGMMSTIINVGINPEIAQGLAEKTGNTWFAWDNYRRFIQSWAMSHGLEREVFSSLMETQKARYGVKKKASSAGRKRGKGVEDDPFEQLLA